MALVGAVPAADGFTDQLVVVEPAHVGVKHLLHFQGFQIAPPLTVDKEDPVLGLEGVFVGGHVKLFVAMGLKLFDGWQIILVDIFGSTVSLPTKNLLSVH